MVSDMRKSLLTKTTVGLNVFGSFLPLLSYNRSFSMKRFRRRTKFHLRDLQLLHLRSRKDMKVTSQTFVIWETKRRIIV
jgi:hypothetical protein